MHNVERIRRIKKLLLLHIVYYCGDIESFLGPEESEQLRCNPEL